MEKAGTLAEDGHFQDALSAVESALVLAPDLESALTLRAELVAYVKGDFMSAAADLRRAISFHPASPVLYDSLSFTLWAKGDLIEAGEAISHYEELGGQKWIASNARALFKVSAGDLTGALSDAKAAIEAGGEEFATYDTLGFVYLQRKEWQLAEAAYVKSLKSAPDLIYARLGLGVVRWEAGAQEEGRSLLAESLKRLKDQPFRDNDLRINPQLNVLSEHALRLLGDVAIKKAIDLEEARRYEDAIATLQEMAGWSWGKYLAYAHGESGNLYRDLNLVDKAIEQYSRAIELEPKAHRFLGRSIAFLDSGKYPEARADADSAIGLDDTISDLYRVRGLARSKLGDLRGAVEDLKIAIRLEPNTVLLYAIAGDMQISLQDFDAARVTVDKGLAIDVAYPPLRLQRALLRYQRQDNAGSLEDLNFLLDGHWNPPEREQATLYLFRANVHKNLGNKDLARADAESALTIPVLSSADEQAIKKFLSEL